MRELSPCIDVGLDLLLYTGGIASPVQGRRLSTASMRFHMANECESTGIHLLAFQMMP